MKSKKKKVIILNLYLHILFFFHSCLVREVKFQFLMLYVDLFYICIDMDQLSHFSPPSIVYCTPIRTHNTYLFRETTRGLVWFGLDGWMDGMGWNWYVCII